MALPLVKMPAKLIVVLTKFLQKVKKLWKRKLSECKSNTSMKISNTVVSLGFTPFALKAATLYLVRASSTWQQVALIFGSCHFLNVSSSSTMIWKNL